MYISNRLSGEQYIEVKSWIIEHSYSHITHKTYNEYSGYFTCLMQDMELAKYSQYTIHNTQHIRWLKWPWSAVEVQKELVDFGKLEIVSKKKSPMYLFRKITL